MTVSRMWDFSQLTPGGVYSARDKMKITDFKTKLAIMQGRHDDIMYLTYVCEVDMEMVITRLVM